MTEEAIRHFDLLAVVREVVEEYPFQVEEYRKGRPYLGFLLGRVMKRLKDSGGYPGPMIETAAEVQAALREVLHDG